MGRNFYMTLALSPFLPAVVGLIRYKRMGKMIHPFFAAMVLAFLTELSYAIATRLFNNYELSFVIYYIYILLNVLLYIFFFYRIGIIRSVKAFQVILIFGFACWASGLFFTLHINRLFVSNLLCSVIILILSTELLSKQILETKRAAHKNFYFLMGIGSVMFTAFFIFFVSIWFLGHDDHFRTRVYTIQKFVDAGCYFLFAIALLCLPAIRTSSK